MGLSWWCRNGGNEMALTLDALKDNPLDRIVELERRIAELERTRPWIIIDSYVVDGAIQATGYLPMTIIVDGVETTYKVLVAT